MLTTLEVKDVQHYVSPAIQQDDVSSNQNVRAIRRGRRQPPFQVLRTRLQAFLKTWRKLTASHKLFFQPWRQPVFLGESWWKIGLMVVIPPANVAVMVPVVMLALIVVISVFVVTFPVAIALRKCGTGRQYKKAKYYGEHSLYKFHASPHFGRAYTHPKESGPGTYDLRP